VEQAHHPYPNYVESHESRSLLNVLFSGFQFSFSNEKSGDVKAKDQSAVGRMTSYYVLEASQLCWFHSWFMEWQ